MDSAGYMKSGYRERYDARLSGRRKDKERPWAAFHMARRMSVLVITAVERARHDAMVKGLNRNLEILSANW